MIYYPGHGKPLKEPREMVLAQIKHRRDREKQICNEIKRIDRQIEHKNKILKRMKDAHTEDSIKNLEDRKRMIINKCVNSR